MRPKAPVGEVHVRKEFIVPVPILAHPRIARRLMGVGNRLGKIPRLLRGDVKFRRRPFQIVEIAALAVVIRRPHGHGHGDARLTSLKVSR